MTSLNKQARIAGALYILLALIAPLRLMVIPQTIFVSGNAAATAANIVAHETLFRFGIVADLLSGMAIVIVTLALYRLFKDSGRTSALLMVILGGVFPGVIYFLNVANDAAALKLIGGAPYLDVFDRPQREALALLFLHLHGAVVTAAEMLWGIWLLPLALLVWRCGFVPRVFAIWLALNGLAYIVQSVVGFIAPAHADALESICFPLQLGEIAFMLWMLVMGARPRSISRETAS
ncbi:MAG: DUF4386 domain-containing protein [Luteibacter sp.]